MNILSYIYFALKIANGLCIKHKSYTMKKEGKIMLKKIRKSAIVLASVIVIGSTMLPAQAVSATEQPTATILNEESGIMPLTADIPSLSTSCYATSITVYWIRPSGAVKYVVTCGSKSKTLNTTDARPTVTFTSLTSKTRYSIKVKAYNSSGTLIASGSTTATTK